MDNLEKGRKNRLRPLKPVMSWPWIDGRPEPQEKVRNRIEIDGVEYDLYWGELHGHSTLSPDSWYHTPEQYYEYGRETAGLDFCALTDHDAPEGLGRYPGRWHRTIEVAERFNEPGSFAAIAAYEWTSGTPEGSMLPRIFKWKRYDYLDDPKHFGHRNVYFPGGDYPDTIFSHDNPDYTRPEQLWEAMRPYGAISIPHHPLGGPVCPLKWEHYDEECEPVVEIYSTHGNSEHEGCMHEIYNPYRNGRHSVRAALEGGRRFGFIASSDSHMGLAGNFTRPDFNISFSQFYFGGRQRPPGPGIAALYLEELTRDAIFDALRARRCYAVTWGRVVMDVRAGGVFMGGELPAGREPVEVSISVRAGKPVHRIDIIKNGRTVQRCRDEGPDVEITYIDGARERDCDYIYSFCCEKRKRR